MKLINFAFLAVFLMGMGYGIYAMEGEESEREAVNNALFASVQKGVEAVQRALKDGGDPNFVNDKGIPVILRAAVWHQLDVIKLLVNAGANINSANTKAFWFAEEYLQPGVTPFYEYARGNFDTDAFEWFLQHGAYLNIGPGISGARCLIYSYGLTTKRFEKIEHQLRWFLEHGLQLTANDLADKEIVEYVERLYRNHPLLQAIVLRHDVGDLIAGMKKKAKKGQLSDADSRELNDAFILAAVQGSPVLVDLFETPHLLNAILPQTFRTAFVRAALIGDVHELKMIIRYVQRSEQITAVRISPAWVAAFRDALAYAYGQGQKQAIEFLTEYNTELGLDIDVEEVKRREERQEVPVKGKEKEGKGKEKEHEKEPEKEKEKEKETSTKQPKKHEKSTELYDELDEAIRLGDNKKVKALLEAGVEPNAPSSNVEPAITVAGLYGNIEAVELLVEHGADINATMPPGTNQSTLPGQTPGWSPWLPDGNVVWAFVDFARRRPKADILPALEWLEAHGADLNHYNSEGYSVIAAVSRQDRDLLRWLFEHGITLTQANLESSRTIEQVQNAFGKDSVQAIIILANTGEFGDLGEATKRVDEWVVNHRVNKHLYNELFLMAVAQNTMFKYFIKTLGRFLTPQGLQRALLVAASTGNYVAAEAIVRFAGQAINEGADNWYQAGLRALDRAIARGRKNIVSLLLRALPRSVIEPVIQDIRETIRQSTQIEASDRKSLLEQLDKALVEPSREPEQHLSPAGSAAISRLIASLPSGLIPGLVTLLFGTIQHSKTK